jgi:hypothetical protein
MPGTNSATPQYFVKQLKLCPKELSPEQRYPAIRKIIVLRLSFTTLSSSPPSLLHHPLFFTTLSSSPPSLLHHPLFFITLFSFHYSLFYHSSVAESSVETIS